MTAPPPMAATTGPNLRANGERQDQNLSARALMREASEFCSEQGLPISRGYLRRFVSGYIEFGIEAVDFRAWLTDTIYEDPTGETAAWNVVRGGRRG